MDDLQEAVLDAVSVAVLVILAVLLANSFLRFVVILVVTAMLMQLSKLFGFFVRLMLLFAVLKLFYDNGAFSSWSALYNTLVFLQLKLIELWQHLWLPQT